MGMADHSVTTDAISIGFGEAVEELPPSPTTEWGNPYRLAKGDRLAVPIVSNVTRTGLGTNVVAMTSLSLKLPLDVGEIVSLSSEELLNAHRFLHTIDILAWDPAKFSWIHEYRPSHIAWMLCARYRDPLWGELQWAQMVAEESLTDHHHRRYILGECVKRIEYEREILAAKGMSEIDAEVMTRGLDCHVDYWRPSR